MYIVQVLGYIQLGGKKKWMLHTNARRVIQLNLYKNLKNAGFVPLYAGVCPLLFAT